MKLDTTILVTKACCYVAIGFCTPLTVGLAQWANSGEWPGKIIWVVMAGSCMVGAATQLLSFLSGSYSDFVKGRSNGNSASDDTTQFILSKTAKQSLDQTTQPKT